MNGISDERLRYWETVLAENATYNGVYLAKTGEEARELRDCIVELITLRSLNKRLVEAGDKLADSVSAWMTQYKPESSIVQSINRNNMRTWDALMKELEEK